MRRPITATSGTRLAVLGSPIAHSRSPLLHAAAYEALGLDWSYEAIEVAGEGLGAFIAGLDGSWRGLSLTMPLKREVLPLLAETDVLVRQTGAANTVLLGDGHRGFNTDVFGITEAFRDSGIHSVETVQILGGGATAASALAAVAQLGATRVAVCLRDPAKAGELVRLGSVLDLAVTVLPLGEEPERTPDAVVSTLPGRSEHRLVFPAATRSGAVLFDVAYDPWPSPLGAAWAEAGGRVISGLEMLTLQALAQVRIFVSGSAAELLPDEPAVLAAMRRAVAA